MTVFESNPSYFIWLLTKRGYMFTVNHQGCKLLLDSTNWSEHVGEGTHIQLPKLFAFWTLCDDSPFSTKERGQHREDLFKLRVYSYSSFDLESQRVVTPADYQGSGFRGWELHPYKIPNRCQLYVHGEVLMESSYSASHCPLAIAPRRSGSAKLHPVIVHHDFIQKPEAELQLSYRDIPHLFKSMIESVLYQDSRFPVPTPLFCRGFVWFCYDQDFRLAARMVRFSTAKLSMTSGFAEISWHAGADGNVAVSTEVWRNHVTKVALES